MQPTRRLQPSGITLKRAIQRNSWGLLLASRRFGGISPVPPSPKIAPKNRPAFENRPEMRGISARKCPELSVKNLRNARSVSHWKQSTSGKWTGVRFAGSGVGNRGSGGLGSEISEERGGGYVGPGGRARGPERSGRGAGAVCEGLRDERSREREKRTGDREESRS